MRKLTKTLAVVSLLAPVDSFPLGIGNMKLNSALNQKLNAEIAINLEASESIDDIRVSLALPEKFDELGVPWTATLEKIRFEPVVKANGTAIIKLSSEATIQEPFLSFLVKIKWPKGSQYKEFTVLVDPPATYLQPVIPVSTVTGGASRNSTFDVTTSPYSNQTNTQSNGANALSGRVQVNDTLWEIADRVNAGRSSSIHQMMIALYRANPEAFYQNNVNTLSAGAILNVPDNDAVLRLSARQARAEFARQNRQWQNRSSTTSVAASSSTGSQLKLIAPDKSGIDQQATVTTKDVDGSASMSGMVPGAAGNAELTARLEELERQLAVMQATLAIKDEQLAAIQTAGMVPEQLAVATEAEEPMQELLEDQQPEPEIAPEVKPEIAPEVEPEIVKPKLEPDPVEVTKPVSKRVQTKDDSSFSPWLAVIIAMIAGLLGWLWWRKRKIESVTAEESMFSSAFDPTSGAEISEFSSMGSTPVSEDFSFQTGTIGESSILSEFTPSDFDAFETDQSEVDPISEADVYLAYGRYQQAEELMRQAIKDQPDRDECKLKLLEIFYANENAQEFENYAIELKASGKDQDHEFWGRVVEMGTEICPGLEIFNDTTEQQGSSVFNVTDEEESPEAESTLVADATEDPELDAIDFEMPTDDSGATDDLEADDTVEGFDFDTSETTDSDAEDIEFDFEMSSDSDSEDDVVQGDELVDMDELETKIDLARAYVDMGDNDAAKTIAEEVLKKGNDAQKLEAQKILDSV